MHYVIYLHFNLSYETTEGTENMWSLKTGGLLTQVNYSDKYAFGGLKGNSLNTVGV